METIEKTKFKPILIHTDKERIEQSIKSANNIADQLNEKLNLVEAFLGTPLSETDKLDILNKGTGSFMRLLRKQYQFPNATDEFNVTSMGKEKEFEPTKKALSNIVSLYAAYDFELTDGHVKLSNKGKQAIEKANKVFTTNEKQNEAYELALKVSENLNTAFNQGFIDKSDLHQIERGLKLAKLPTLGGDKISPNTRFISSIRKDGGVSSMY